MIDKRMSFELTMRLIFGEKAFHIASHDTDPAITRKWLRRVIKEFLLTVDSLDTTPRHRSLLMYELENLNEELRGLKTPSWYLVYGLIRLCARLLGFDYLNGARCHTLTYWQSPGQHYYEDISRGGDAQFYDKKDAISIRRQVIKNLKNEKLTNFQISLVLNTSEYEIKKLSKGI